LVKCPGDVNIVVRKQLEKGMKRCGVAWRIYSQPSEVEQTAIVMAMKEGGHENIRYLVET
jgi:hypothetical protein